MTVEKNDEGLRLARLRPGCDGSGHGLPGVWGLRPRAAGARELSRSHRPSLCRRCVHGRRGRGRRVASNRGLGAAALTVYYALFVVILMNGRLLLRYYAVFVTYENIAEQFANAG